MRYFLIGCFSFSLALAFGQETVSAPPVDQIIEKSIAAAGGRDAMMKMTSLVGIGSLEIVAMGANASFEVYMKAPNKRLTVTVVEGYGEIKRGYDGKAGWNSEPQNGLVDLAGEELAALKREAVFNGELHWKELYPKAEVTGKGKVGTRDCWIVKLTPAEGPPVTHYYDAETFQGAKVISATAQGEIPVELSDYRDIGNGVKSPYTMKITQPGIGELIIRFKEFRPNAQIDDAKFAKPQ
ncbi:MAG TPA: hypothetical protein VLY04_05625 [Bryobacteraceae bacterium]|nr:hypothetical protein [Bryobacteraceae bacterium]